MRERKDILADIDRTIREVDRVSVLSPKFYRLMDQRNRLMIELEQSACPVHKQGANPEVKTIPKPNINRFRN